MPAKILYEFSSFLLDPVARTLSRDGEHVAIRPIAFDLLLVLVENHGQALAKVELIKRVWETDAGDDRNFHVTLGNVRKALGDSAKTPRFIVIEPSGYRFAADVRVLGRAASIQSRHVLHIVVSCALYAALFALALILEVAYEFNRYGAAAKKLAGAVFVWIFITSVAGTLIDRKLTLKDQKNGLVGTVSIFFVAALTLFGALTYFLPNSPITLAEFQTYPAQAAYLKDTLYFLLLALLFLIFPFHFIITLEREAERGNCSSVIETVVGSNKSAPPVGAIYPRFWALGLLLVALAIISLVMIGHLLDNLMPGEYRNLFIVLVYLRGGLYFGLGIESLAWYRKALNDITRQCQED